MEITIGINVKEATKEAINFLDNLEDKYNKIRTVEKCLDSYNSFKDDFASGVKFNIARKQGARIKDITTRNKGIFTEYLITV